MVAKSYRNLKIAEKSIVLPKEQVVKFHRLFGVSEQAVYSALRFATNSERALAIREAALKTGVAVVQVTRPMALYDIYIKKNLDDPTATAVE